jgi:hypothetical protein
MGRSPKMSQDGLAFTLKNNLFERSRNLRSRFREEGTLEKALEK